MNILSILFNIDDIEDSSIRDVLKSLLYSYLSSIKKGNYFLFDEMSAFVEKELGNNEYELS